MKTISFAALGAAVLMLSGFPTFSNMESGLSALMGEEEKTAFQVLGDPLETQDFGGDTVYTWNTSRAMVVMIPQIATTGAPAGAAPGPARLTCHIKLTANEQGRLTTWDYGGNLGVCRSYIGRLNDYASASGKA